MSSTGDASDLSEYDTDRGVLDPLCVLCYFKCSRWARRDSRPSRGVPARASPPAGPSSFVRVISSSMVMSTRPGPFCSPSTPFTSPFSFSPFPTDRSKLVFSLPQPDHQSYFLSLRDSGFFFSVAAEVPAEEDEPGRRALEGSAVGVWPCGRDKEGEGEGQGGDRGENGSVRSSGMSRLIHFHNRR